VDAGAWIASSENENHFSQVLSPLSCEKPKVGQYQHRLPLMALGGIARRSTNNEHLAGKPSMPENVGVE
jgi:hypothetical protein